MDDEALVTQCYDVAQHRSPGSTNLPCQVVNRRGSAAPEDAHDSAMSEANVHLWILAHAVPDYGTNLL
ncbi:hypothetical protein C8J35_11192 [Rhizobium sp. PP-F2F-G38]|nr:hypothetical protein C8J37_11192 [Rhizobium sp. PP-WC-1G-195]PYE94036.1 hypothetical protein C8J35_11192 [Rhizobium sp. PP-F2F-G38]